MDRLRDVILGLTEGGKRPVTNSLLFQTLGRDDEAGKRRLLRQLQDMVNRGELVRTGRGEMRYDPSASAARHGPLYDRIWRAIRAKQPGFGVNDVALVTGAGKNHTYKYMRWLESEGYLRRQGKSGNSVLFVTTAKARAHRGTPFPPAGITDPYENERNAACRLVRLLMERNPDAVRGDIGKNCAIIMDRFGRDKTAGVAPAGGEA